MASKPKDSLDVLQSMVNEVLVQTGKALRAATRDGSSGSGQVTTSLKPKIEASSTVFHSALDDIECEIIAAKSVLMRDLAVLKAKKGGPPKQTPVPVPVIPHIPQKQAPAAPMGVDVGSPKISTTPIRPPQLAAIQKVNAAAVQKKESKPAAPFPDMGMGMGMGMDVGSAIPVDLTSGKGAKIASPKVALKPNPKAGAGAAQGGQRLPGAGQGKASMARTAPMGIGSSAAGMLGTTTVPQQPSALPFTDYEFSLAPSSDPIELTSASASGPDPPASSVSLGVSSGGGHNAAIATPPQQPKPAAAPAPMGINQPHRGMAGAGGSLTAPAPAAPAVMEAKQAENPPPASDDLYNLGDGSGMDLGPDMGSGGVDTNNFDDMFFGDDGSYETTGYLGLD